MTIMNIDENWRMITIFSTITKSRVGGCGLDLANEVEEGVPSESVQEESPAMFEKTTFKFGVGTENPTND